MTTRRSSASTTRARRSGGSTRAAPSAASAAPVGRRRSPASGRGRVSATDRRRVSASGRASPSFPPIPWIVGFRGPSLPWPLGGAISRGELAGLLLFRDNFGESWEQATALCREIRGLVPRGQPFLLAADEEGGLISQTARLRLPDGSTWPGVPTPRALGRIDDPAAARFVGRLLGRRLRSLGCTVDFAPSLDLDTEPESPVIGSRSFGSDPLRVAALGEAFARGLGDAGVAACYKHFPGHGGTRQDSHRELPRMNPSSRRRHAQPFRDCLRRAGTEPPWVMSAHVDWGSGLPASLDPAMVARLRRWSPRALRVTDALEMRALRSVEWAAERAWRAGNDLLLVGRDWRAGLAAMRALARAGELGGGGSADLPRSRRAARAVRRRVLPEWERRDPERLRPVSPFFSPHEHERLLRLHRRALRWCAPPTRLPEGPWIWFVPEGLRPYADLRGWRPPRLRRRPVERIEWIPEAPSAEWARGAAARARKSARPILWATVFRGRPAAGQRAALDPILRLPDLAGVAHLLDECWPEPPPDGRFVTILTSGPCAEALDALAEALDAAP